MMKLRVVKEDEKTLILEIGEESVGFANLLREELWKDKNVKEAAQIKEHPYLSEPKVFVRVSRGNPRTALEKAARRIENQAKEFKEEFEKALKK
jgi:DNA-directed RNA polymerase subunit L